jgi:hypothetical protein
MNRARQRMIDAREAKKVGCRYHAFYQGYHAFRTSRPGNPNSPGTEEHSAWQAGWEYAQCEEELT